MTTTGSGISPATDWAGQAGLARAWHRQDGASSNLVDEARELADSAGVPDHAPYDRIIVTTGTWDLATQWWAQLGPAGRIVLPLSIRGIQLSVGLETAGDHLVSRSACRCSFIRMAAAITGPESLLALGPQPGLHAQAVDGPAPDADALYEALSGPVTEEPTGLRAGDVGELADGVAAFIPGDQPAPYDITARGYGPSGPGLAKYTSPASYRLARAGQAGRAGSGTECLASRSAARADRRREHRHRPAPCPPRRAMADVVTAPIED